MSIAHLAAHAVAQVLGKSMDEVFVTGSRVIGAHNDNSDIDIVVRVEPGHRTEWALRTLGGVEPLSNTREDKYGEEERVFSGNIFYLAVEGLTPKINVICKQHIQFEAWQYATSRLADEAGNPLMRERETRVLAFKAWRQAYAFASFLWRERAREDAWREHHGID